MRITTYMIISFVVLLHLAKSFAQYPPKPWPTYSSENMPRTGFSCQAKILGGYYADPETQCQMFHVCVKVAGVGVKDFRFLCPNGTAFDQEAQICADWGDVDCEQSTLYYSSDNFDLYRLGSGFESKRAPVLEDEQPFHLQNAESNDLRRTSQQNTNSQSFKRNNGGNNNEDSSSYSKKPNYSNLRKVPNVRTTSTTTTTESSYYADRRGDDEIFKGSHSSNFFNNRNNGKEDDLVDFPQKTQQPRVQNYRGRQRPQNNFRNSNSNSNNNIQPFPTKASDVPALPSTLSTTTSTTYAPTTTTRANFVANDASEPQINVKTISLQSSFSASDSSSLNDNSQRFLSSTADTPFFQRNNQQQADTFFKSTSQLNIQPTTYSPPHNHFSYDSSSPANEDFRRYEKTSSTPAPNFKQPPQNSFYNAQFENRATESYDQLRNQDLPAQGAVILDTSSTVTPVIDVVRTVPKTNTRINAQRPASFNEEPNDYNEGQNYFNERQNSFNQRQNSNDGTNSYSNTRQNNFSERPSTYTERTNSYTEKQNSFVDRSSSYNARQNTHKERQSSFNERQNSFNGRQNTFNDRQNERKAFNDQQNQQFSNRNAVQQATPDYPQPPPKPQRSRRPTQYRGSQHFNKALLDEAEVSSPLNVKPLEIQTQPSSTTENSGRAEQNQFNRFTNNFRPTVRPIQSSTASSYDTPKGYNSPHTFGFSDSNRASPSPFSSPPEQTELGPSNKQNDRFAQNSFDPLPTYNEAPRGFSLNPPYANPNPQSRQTTTAPKSSFSKKFDEQPYDNFTPSTQAKKFSTLVPKDQFYPTTFKPATYKKLIQRYDPKIGTSTKFAASSYLPTSTTTTLRPQPVDSQIDEDDGQYHPELYEKDFVRNKAKTRNEQYSERTFNRRPTEPPTDAEDDEFLNTAHSLNIAAGANRLRAEKNKQSSPPIISRPTPVSAADSVSPTSKPVSAPKSQHHSTSAKKNNKPQNEDASYDYAYYDSFGGNPQDYDYDLNLEFGKTRKN